MKNNTLIKVKVFLIIGMVLTFYLIFPIVLGVMTIKKIHSSNDPEEIRNWGIISLIFVNFVGGVLILASDSSRSANKNLNESENETNSNPNSVETLLRDLKKLYDDGIIDVDFYEAKRKEYLNRL